MLYAFGTCKIRCISVQSDMYPQTLCYVVQRSTKSKNPRPLIKMDPDAGDAFLLTSETILSLLLKQLSVERFQWRLQRHTNSSIEHIHAPMHAMEHTACLTDSNAPRRHKCIHANVTTETDSWLCTKTRPKQIGL